MQGLEIHEACTAGDYDSLEDYINSGKYDINMKDPDWGNRAPIHWAATKGYADCIRLLLDHGADGCNRMCMGWTPAHCAAETGKIPVLRALHNASVPVNKKDKYGETPRGVARTYGHWDAVKFLDQCASELKEQKMKDGKVEEDTESTEEYESDSETT